MPTFIVKAPLETLRIPGKTFIRKVEIGGSSFEEPVVIDGITLTDRPTEVTEDQAEVILRRHSRFNKTFAEMKRTPVAADAEDEPEATPTKEDPAAEPKPAKEDPKPEPEPEPGAPVVYPNADSKTEAAGILVGVYGVDEEALKGVSGQLTKAAIREIAAEKGVDFPNL